MEGGKVVVALGGGRRNFQTVENGGRRSLKDLVNRFLQLLTPNEILISDAQETNVKY